MTEYLLCWEMSVIEGSKVHSCLRMYLQYIPIPRHISLRTDDSIQILVNLTWIINGTI